jgi:hypothetical protein
VNAAAVRVEERPEREPRGDLPGLQARDPPKSLADELDETRGRHHAGRHRRQRGGGPLRQVFEEEERRDAQHHRQVGQHGREERDQQQAQQFGVHGPSR